jgi:hypothetical protein
MLQRPQDALRLSAALRRSRVVALIGPRQCGKTTLARQLVRADSLNYFDLEDPRSLARLAEPMTALESLRGLVVIDEVQRRPEIFPVLRVLSDRRPLRARFLILGSASPELLRQSSETLAGRIEIVELGGLSLHDVGESRLDRHWLRGGFPLAYLARSNQASQAWREAFIGTFLERDIPALGSGIAPAALRRFWTMLAHYHGQVWNGAELARAIGTGEATARRYLDLLTGVFMVRELRPWHENLGKRQVKSPKVYVRDSGLLHTLLGIGSERELQSHPKVGASWEGYALEETLRRLRPTEAYFWATHAGAELDLLLLHQGRRYGVEFKRSDAPTVTPSMRSAIADLGVERLLVIYPGTQRYRLSAQIEALPLTALDGLGRARARVGRNS